MENLSAERTKELLGILKKRFEKHMDRHLGLDWTEVENKLMKSPAALSALHLMEETEGEPDVIAYDKTKGTITFGDCSAESPKGRRSICYDQAALDSRKEHKPKQSAMGMAKEMGIEIMDEQQYAALQALGKFDNKSSSWLKTPDAVRKLGGAIFGDYRYDRVFTYHNGAESYYAARGFRGIIEIA